MRDLLRRFASVPLALAAYNAGPGARGGAAAASRRTRRPAGYVARILGLLAGAGDAGGPQRPGRAAGEVTATKGPLLSGPSEGGPGRSD